MHILILFYQANLVVATFPPRISPSEHTYGRFWYLQCWCLVPPSIPLCAATPTDVTGHTAYWGHPWFWYKDDVNCCKTQASYPSLRCSSRIWNLKCSVESTGRMFSKAILSRANSLGFGWIRSGIVKVGPRYTLSCSTDKLAEWWCLLLLDDNLCRGLMEDCGDGDQTWLLGTMLTSGLPSWLLLICLSIGGLVLTFWCLDERRRRFHMPIINRRGMTFLTAWILWAFRTFRYSTIL